MGRHLYYPKIETLFNRGEDFKVIPDNYRMEEFDYVRQWLMLEKVDGMNISLVYTTNSGNYRGRTQNAQFNAKQQTFLSNLVQDSGIRALSLVDEYNLESLEVFGELFGPGVNRGGGYGGELQFRVYDMRVDNKVWLDHQSVLNNCEHINLEHVPYWDDLWETHNVVRMVQGGFKSLIPGSDIEAEGLVLKTPRSIYNQQGKRIIAKLKHRDF